MRRRNLPPVGQGYADAAFLYGDACDGTAKLSLSLQRCRHRICHALRSPTHKLHWPARTVKYGERAKDVKGGECRD